MTIGIDLADRQSHVCVLNDDGEVVEAGTVPTTQPGMRRRFERCEPTRIAIEAGRGPPRSEAAFSDQAP